MKRLLIIIVIFMPAFCFSQNSTKRDSTLYIVDGMVLSQKEVLQLDIDRIENISVLKEFPAGMDARNPIVVITIKKEVYEATVLDAGFESFLTAQKSKEFYSLAGLKAKNRYLVSVWNYRCGRPSRYNPQVYGQKIDYESHLDYGLDVEYIVYMFFKFMKEKNDLSFDLVLN